ncbi:hypothetical protein GLAREA_04098 [Glarea lozoyensis ATCC 20868]|uniref:Uncharacterized protein n=1 Tax=Glarea lozoyensis (strain ATCC 20868 / MF5171) TaxID=1116229 RepID=S3DGH3_GLAL2|nr:uncharacterized protein GLAREA_04098 [Glarea lozoyensis ATCC 20868]EPE31131.1 hypothetical protein GLAREA_04098 [Glarea lozoyensis ATCC 20868]
MSKGNAQRGQWRSQWARLRPEGNELQVEDNQKSNQQVGIPGTRTETATSNFQFVNISEPSEIVDPKTKAFVRKHVWRHRKKGGRAVTIRPLLSKIDKGNSSKSQMTPPLLAQSQALQRRLLPASPRTLVRNDLVDATVYPVPMTDELRQLVYLMHKQTEENVTAFRDVWFSLVLCDEGAFFQLMSTVRFHYGRLYGRSDEAGQEMAAAYNIKAIQSVNSRLVNVAQSTTEELIGAVICFLTYNHITQNVPVYAMHKAGIARIISLRGGISTLEANYNVRLMLLWDDVCGKFAFNIPPSFGLPISLLPPPLHDLDTISYKNHSSCWDVFAPDFDAIDVFSDLRALSSVIEKTQPEIWLDPNFLGLYVNPLALRILSIGEKADPTSLLRACKLAATLHIAKIRQRCMVYHITGPHFEEELHQMLEDGLVDWENRVEVELWVLMTFAVITNAQRRRGVLGRIIEIVELLRIQSFLCLIENVSKFVWLDSVVETENLILEIDLRRIQEREGRWKRVSERQPE